LPAPTIIDRIESVQSVPGVTEMLRELVEQWRDHQSTLTADEIESLTRLDRIAQRHGMTSS
jgi:hypothetical protein